MGRRVSRVLLGDDHVEVAGPGGAEGSLRLVLDDLDAHVRVLERHRAKGRGQERECCGLEHGHADGALDFGRRGVECAARRLEDVEDLAGRPGEDLALRREVESAAAPPKQGGADVALELRQLL